MFSNSYQRISQLMFVILTSLVAAYSVLYKGASMFFIIYLFWMDEFIRTIFELIRVKKFKFLKYKNEHKPIFQQSNQPMTEIKGRFFMLILYWVFIIVLFGFVFSFKSKEMFMQNILIMFFKNTWFNISIVIAFLSEFKMFAEDYYRYKNNDATLEIESPGAFDRNVLVLHLSIIFGALLWAVTHKWIPEFQIHLGAFNDVVMILPFVIFKLAFELYHFFKPPQISK